MKLDVGCGEFLRGDVGVDVAKTGACHVVADGQYLPFRDETFDSLHAQCVLEHLADPTLGLSEFMRVLKSNGLVTIIVPKPWLTNNLFSKLVKVLFDFPFSLLPHNFWYQIKTAWQIHTESRWRRKVIISIGNMKRAGEKLGFQIVELVEMADSIFYSLYYFHRRGMFRRFFKYKPKLYRLNRFVCKKDAID